MASCAAPMTLEVVIDFLVRCPVKAGDCSMLARASPAAAGQATNGLKGENEDNSSSIKKDENNIGKVSRGFKKASEGLVMPTFGQNMPRDSSEIRRASPKESTKMENSTYCIMDRGEVVMWVM